MDFGRPLSQGKRVIFRVFVNRPFFEQGGLTNLTAWVFLIPSAAIPPPAQKMKTYDLDYFKDSNLTPDEKNAMRRNQSGVWLVGPLIQADSPRRAIAAAHKQGFKRVRISNR